MSSRRFYHWPQLVLEWSEATGSARFLLLVLAHHANDKGLCWPSVGLLAIEMNTGRRQVSRLIAQVIELGELAVEKRGGRGRGDRTRYRLLVSERVQAVERVSPATPLVTGLRVSSTAAKGVMQGQKRAQIRAQSGSERLERSEPARSTSPRPMGRASGPPRPPDDEIWQYLLHYRADGHEPDSLEQTRRVAAKLAPRRPEPERQRVAANGWLEAVSA